MLFLLVDLILTTLLVLKPQIIQNSIEGDAVGFAFDISLKFFGYRCG